MFESSHIKCVGRRNIEFRLLTHSSRIERMFISIARQIVVLIPAAYLLSLSGVLRSVWFAFPIAEVASLILSLFFLRTTLKKTGMAMPKTK